MNRQLENVAIPGLLATLCSVGVLMVYSSSYAVAISRGLSADHLLHKHLIAIVVGLCGFLAIQKIKYCQIRRVIPFVSFLGAVSLLLVFHPDLGADYGGSRRWLDLGPLTVQPTEFCQFILLGLFAYLIDNNQKNEKHISHTLMPVVLVWLIASCLILIQPNYGMFAEFGILFLIVLFITGLSRASLAGLLLLYICALGIFVIASDYRMARVEAFLDPYSHYRESGYQVVQSLVGFSNGGLLGTGIGLGKQKLFYLPEAYNDYIFAVVGEELGFVGVFGIATTYLALLLVCLRIAKRAPDTFGEVFAFGTGVLLTLSAFLNMSVCLKLLPPTGLVLPFISYGGSSMVASVVALGVVHRVGSEGRRS